MKLLNRFSLQHMMGAVVLLFAITCFAQDKAAEKTFTLLPHWKSGETVQYDLSKTIVKSNVGTGSSQGTSYTGITIEVLKASPSGYLLSWTYGETNLDQVDPEAKKNPMMREMLNIMKNVQILLEVDSNGNVVKVSNWKEIQIRMNTLVNEMMAYFKSQGMDQASADKMAEQIKSAYADEAGIQATTTKDAELLLSAFGKPYAPGAVFEFEAILPNILGGQAIAGNGELKLLAGFPSSEVDVSWKLSYDPKALSIALEQFVLNPVGNVNQPIPNADNTSSNQVAELHIDGPSGWVKEMTHIKTIKVFGVSRTETTNLVRKK